MALRVDRHFAYRSPIRGGGPSEDKPQTLWIPSPNFNDRPRGPADIDTIVLHHTASGGTAQDTARYFQDPSADVSSHYVVGKDGTIVQSVPDGKRAWHAGESSFKGRDDVNDFSIGIEIVNLGDGRDPYPDAQYEALADLVAWLMKTYGVPMDRITGHRDVALPRGRKSDPSDNFDRDRLRSMVQARLDGAAGNQAPAPGPAAAAPRPGTKAEAPPTGEMPGVQAAAPGGPALLPPAGPALLPVEPVIEPFPVLLARLHDMVEQLPASSPAWPPSPVPGPVSPESTVPPSPPSVPDPTPVPAPVRSRPRSARPSHKRPRAEEPRRGGSGPLLRRGTRGEPVKALQRRLAELGIDPGPLDGIFGPRTEAAVRAFQRREGIEVDGIVGPQTWDRLGIEVEGDVQRADPGANLDVSRDGDMAVVQGFKMTPGTAEAFVAMARAASRDGITLRINSAWRSDEHQARLWEEALRKYGSAEAARKWVAPPGKSNHRTGKALDIHTTDAIYAWLKANAPKFGFRQPMSWEPWHWEFQG